MTDQVAPPAIVLDEKNGFRSLAQAALRRGGIRSSGLRVDAREIQVKGGAMPDLTPHIDPASAGRHDAEDRRQPQSGTLVFFLRCKKRFE